MYNQNQLEQQRHIMHWNPAILEQNPAILGKINSIIQQNDFKFQKNSLFSISFSFIL